MIRYSNGSRNTNDMRELHTTQHQLKHTVWWSG